MKIPESIRRDHAQNVFFPEFFLMQSPRFFDQSGLKEGGTQSEGQFGPFSDTGTVRCERKADR